MCVPTTTILKLELGLEQTHVQHVTIFSLLLSCSYGALRSPWNNNPSPYVTRLQHDNAILPNCNITFDVMCQSSSFPPPNRCLVHS